MFSSFFNAAAGGYEIEQSLRFRGNNTYFTKTFGSSGNRRKFTLSVWVKKATAVAVSPNNTGLNYFGANSGSVGDSMNVGMSASTEAIQFYQYNSGYAGGIYSQARYRDPSAWMHMVFVWDSAQATAADRMAVYVNNRIERPTGSESANTAPSQNKDAAWNNSSYTHTIGGTYQTNDMYLAEAYHIDGQALDPTSFAEYDDNGVWRPIEYTGTYTGNSFYLKFDPSATNGIGHDHSGNGNHWSPTGFDTTNSTASTYDVMSDTPTTNWATLNAIDKASAHTLSEGNFKITQGSTVDNNTASTIAVSSGKWYFEVEITNHAGSTSYDIGIGKDLGRNTVLGNNATSYAYSSSGNKRTNSTNSSYGASFTTGDVLGAAFDADNGTLTFYKNGTSQGQAFTGITDGPYHFLVGTYVSGDVRTVNFGQGAGFAYTPPTGFKALNTSNLPAPTVKDGSEYFNTVTYAGNSPTGQSITVGFQPDWLWIKARSYAGSHAIMDSIRGSNKQLQSNTPNAESTNSAGKGVLSFDTNGFTLGEESDALGSTNGSQTYVAWNWKAGGTGSSNTVGSITSTVSTNPSAGFSIVSYTGTGNAATVGHGLGVAPSLIIEKNRDLNQNWAVYHSALGATKALILDDTFSEQTATYYWNDTAPTSNVFSIGTWNGVNSNTQKHIAYCFAEVESYSRIGSYVGNGNPDGPFVFCGFKPQWILTKSSTLSTVDSNWRITDTARSTYNVSDDLVWANLSNNELANANGFDICSNGFKIRTASNEVNSSGQTYIFAAFAEHPTGGKGVSPATAR